MKSIPGAAAMAMLFVTAMVRAETPAPADVDYPGTLKLAVDATDLDHRIFRVREEIPVAAGPLTLLYPEWLPGNHAPRGPIDKFAGLSLSADGKPVAWKRDSSDVYAFHLDVPAGATTLDRGIPVPVAAGRGAGPRRDDAASMLNLQWNTVALYPAGHYASRITIAPSVKLPDGWQFGTALEATGGAAAGGSVAFKPVSFETLVDSPMFAGRYFKRVDLEPGANAPVHLDIVADEPKDLEFTPEQIKPHRALVQQAVRSCSARITTITTIFCSRSRTRCRNRPRASAFQRERHRSRLLHRVEQQGVVARSAAARVHAFVERQVPPSGRSCDAELQRADGRQPALGLRRADAVLGLRARRALGPVDRASRRATRSRWSRRATRTTVRVSRGATCEDTTNDPVVAARRPLPYRSYQMSEDYYSAGQMIWLAVDAKLRELSHDRHSLDDFARAFFGVDDGSWRVKPYTFDDVVAALNAIAPYDWATFLRQRVDANAPPLDGFAASGWKLVYTDKPSDYQKTAETEGKGRRFLDIDRPHAVDEGLEDHRRALERTRVQGRHRIEQHAHRRARPRVHARAAQGCDRCEREGRADRAAGQERRNLSDVPHRLSRRPEVSAPRTHRRRAGSSRRDPRAAQVSVRIRT